MLKQVVLKRLIEVIVDKSFLNKYHQELKFFRDASKEFATEHPQVANRLGLAAPEVEDPYVERLIEAVSFLTARINLKIDAEYPQFVRHILKVIHPEFTQSIPSAGIVSLKTSIKDGVFLPKLTQIVTHVKKQGHAMCQFSMCQDVQISPFEIEALKYSRQTSISKSIVSFSLNIPSNVNLQEINFEAIRFFIKANDLRTSSELLYFLCQKTTKLNIQVENQSWKKEFNSKINLAGFDDYLGFYNEKNIDYLKHLLEYGVLPNKYLFFKLPALKEIFKDPFIVNLIKKGQSQKLNFTFALNDLSEILERFLDNNALCLNSVIINNAFKKSTRILIDKANNEQHVVVDKLRPNDFEVIYINKVEGFSNQNYKVKVFEPLYKLNNDTNHFDDNSYGFFSEINKPSQTKSKKNSYKGNESYLILTNQIKHVMSDDLSQLSINAWCSNRSLPSEISWTLDQDLYVANEEYKITSVSRQCSFTQPLEMPAENVSQWRLMNLISANFLPLQLDQSNELTQQIKNNLYIIYEMTRSESLIAQINAILNISATKCSRIKRVGQQLTPVNGVHFKIVIDEMLMSHIHPFLWGTILIQYLKGFAPINHFVELTMQGKKLNTIAFFNSI